MRLRMTVLEDALLGFVEAFGLELREEGCGPIAGRIAGKEA